MGKIGKWEKAKSKTLFKWGMFQFLEANGFLFGENMLVDWNKTGFAIWQNYSIQLSYELALVVCVVCFFHHSTLFSCRVCVCVPLSGWVVGWLQLPKQKWMYHMKRIVKMAKLNSVLSAFYLVVGTTRRERESEKKMSNKKGGVCHNVSRYNL